MALISENAYTGGQKMSTTTIERLIPYYSSWISFNHLNVRAYQCNWIFFKCTGCPKVTVLTWTVLLILWLSIETVFDRFWLLLYSWNSRRVISSILSCSLSLVLIHQKTCSVLAVIVNGWVQLQFTLACMVRFVGKLSGWSFKVQNVS